jgi:hypothetical protein
MKNISKKNIYTVPEGYFENLPQKILSKRKKKQGQIYWSGMAAAAVIVIGFLLLVFQPVSEMENQYQAEVNEEVEFYINTGIWGDEEILLMADNPNEILDQIMMEEFSSTIWEEDYSNEEMLF